MAIACMFEQPRVAVQGNLHKWHLNKHIWSLNLNPWFKPTSFNMVASCISSINSILPCHDHASYCRIALIVFSLVCRCLSPFSRRVPTMWSMTPTKTQWYLQKCQASKTPLSIPIQSHSLALALFYCIRTTTLQLLPAAVVEPLSTAWPVIATVNSWNPLAWVGVVWAMLCLLIHAFWLCLLLLRVVSGLIHRGWIGMWWTCPTVES